MIRFNCDYGEGACPEILRRLEETNLEQTPGYGEDKYCAQAAEKLRAACQAPDAAVHFLVGGTQANLTVIAAALRPHQCVLAADTGHVNVHESGAIEATGHKVVGLPNRDGKLTAEQVQKAYEAHWGDETHEHMPQPKLVYISNSTEFGTVYSRRELEALAQVCRECGLLLFMDGARLGYALQAEENDLDLPTIAACCDVFYIGGTKQGALFGEAVLIQNRALQEDFRYLIKQRGGMLAKGRLLGLQFDTLFTDGLYFRLAEHADRMAMKLRDAFKQLGYSFLLESGTNQLFPILPNGLLRQLETDYAFSLPEPAGDGKSSVRLCTSWATRETDVDQLIADVQAYQG